MSLGGIDTDNQIPYTVGIETIINENTEHQRSSRKAHTGASSTNAKNSSALERHAAQLPKQLKDTLKRLKNLLKLPKARRWVYCEFFYSDIDRELLLSENEFRLCLKESFPQLKTRNLTRTEWRQIRRLIGKPRRCSQAFFGEERQVLDQKRRRIRDIYKGVALTLDADLDIPQKLPQPLVVGQKVLSRVRLPKDGVFVCTVDAVMDGRYRVLFDKDVITPCIVADYDVVAETAQDLVPVHFFLEKNKAAQPLTFRGSSTQFLSPIKTLSTSATTATSAGASPLMDNDPMIARPSSQNTPASSAAAIEEKCGNYPLRLIVMLVKLSKLIEMKKSYILQLQEMNAEAERIQMYSEIYLREFQEQYAKIVIELETLNKQLDIYLNGIQEYYSSLLPYLTDVSIASRPEALQKFCNTQAAQIVKTGNATLNVQVKSKPTLELIGSLTGLLLQVRALGQQRCNAFELRTLSDSINEIKKRLHPSNRTQFEDNVEVHLKHIEFTMADGGYPAHNVDY